VFRFLTKPCPPEVLLQALEDGIEQARLVTADRVLLERKIEAMSEDLLRAERLASLGTMAGAIGSELTTVLVVLVGAVNFIRESIAAGKPPRAEDLESLDYARDQLRLHASHLLRFGRPASGGDKGGITDLRKSVGETVGLLRAAGVLRHAELYLRLPDAPVPIRLGHAQVEQVLVNLVKNAVDAGEAERERPRRIEIAVEVSSDGKTVACSIGDNGCGIVAANLPLVFGPYFTTKPSDRGTGLVLFIVKRIIEGHGGTVRIASKEGEGATFTFELPVAPGP
jgi:signal transduction histidine kinase